MVAYQKIAIRIFRIVTVAFAAAVLACCFVGCAGDNVGMRLLRSDISLTVGESRSILPYIELPATSDKSELKLSTDSDGLKINGTTVTAVKPCNAKIMISGYNKSVELSVSVSYREVQALRISMTNAVQTVTSGKPKTVSLSAVFDQTVNSNSVAVWKINGETLRGNAVDFTPPDYGEYAVTATADGASASSVIRVYRKTDVTVIHDFVNILDGYHVYRKTDVTVDQNAKALASLFKPLTFTAYEKVNTLNPKSVYEWTVNGEVKSTSPVLNFTPVKSGEYSVSLMVNGDAKKIDGKDGFTFNALQGLAPAASVEYDDLGGVYVRWAAGLDVLWVSITDGDGKRAIFDITDAAVSHLFGDNSFRATEYIDVCAVDPKRYEISLGSSDGKYDIVFDQLNERARQYLENTVLCKNSFIDGESSAREWVKELYATGKTTAECYVPSGAQSVAEAITEQAKMLGLDATVTADGDVLSVTFAPYVNAPTKLDSATITTAYASLPHIEYSADNRRPTDYVFSSDRARRSVAVSGAEQLLVALYNGYKPTTSNGTPAYSVYLAAKRVLLNIIGADYTPRQKVHAIYDWLQYVTVNVESVDLQSSSRFLEGVFVASRPSGSGYAVTSEGAAKAFMLLCGTEGIPCTISCDAQSGRFYNKVELDGLWYNVDVYSGKVMGGTLNPPQAATEFTSHRGLLISDGELALLGATPNDEQKAFDATASEYMQKRNYGNIYFDNFVDVSEADDYNKVRAAVFNAFDNVARGTIDMPYVGVIVKIYNNSFGVEFAYSDDLTDEQKSMLIAHINKAIDEYESGMTDIEFINNGRMITVGNSMIVIMASRTAGA